MTSPTSSSRLARYAARWRQLDGRQRRQFMVALWQLPLIRLSLRLFGFKRSRRFWVIEGARRAQHPVAHSERLAEAQRTAEAIALAARRDWVRANCLPQALLLIRMLGKLGIDAELHLGVRKSETAGIEAHAWVTLDGAELGSGAMGHQPFAR